MYVCIYIYIYYIYIYMYTYTFTYTCTHNCTPRRSMIGPVPAGPRVPITPNIYDMT